MLNLKKMMGNFQLYSKQPLTSIDFVHSNRGGYGNLLRKYGTAADNVVDVRFIDVNGNILDRKLMGEDLFWAIRGGGVSSFETVLAWKLSLVPVPEKITFFMVTKTLKDGATELFYMYQNVAPYMIYRSKCAYKSSSLLWIYRQ
ncbi:hypothetical protein LXL04_001976 [Taraxacum kok-saghyz]